MALSGSSTWLPAPAGVDTAFERVLGLVPDAQRRYHELERQLWHSDMPAAILELCRIRIAQLLQCPAESAARTGAASVDEATYEAVSRWPTDPAFDEAERAALAFAEQYVIDPASITDDDCVRLSQHFTSPQLAALTTALATFDAMARFEIALGVSDRPEPGR